MKITLLVVLACIAVGAVTAQSCCVPDQLEAYSFGWDIERDFRAGENISYDFTNSRHAVVIRERHGDGEIRSFDIITLWNAHRAYFINWSTKQCDVRPITGSMPRSCLPSTARHVGSPVLGGTLQCDSFVWPAFNNSLSFAIVARANCLPVRDIFMDRRNGIVDESDIWDITLGIRDPAVFTPPSFCPSQLTDSELRNVATLEELRFPSLFESRK